MNSLLFGANWGPKFKSMKALQSTRKNGRFAVVNPLAELSKRLLDVHLCINGIHKVSIVDSEWLFFQQMVIRFYHYSLGISWWIFEPPPPFHNALWMPWMCYWLLRVGHSTAVRCAGWSVFPAISLSSLSWQMLVWLDIFQFFLQLTVQEKRKSFGQSASCWNCVNSRFTLLNGFSKKWNQFQ